MVGNRTLATVCPERPSPPVQALALARVVVEAVNTSVVLGARRDKITQLRPTTIPTVSARLQRRRYSRTRRPTPRLPSDISWQTQICRRLNSPRPTPELIQQTQRKDCQNSSWAKWLTRQLQLTRRRSLRLRSRRARRHWLARARSRASSPARPSGPGLWRLWPVGLLAGDGHGRWSVVSELGCVCGNADW